MSDTAEPAAPSEAVAPPPEPGAPPLLEVRGLAKYYGNIIALEDISTTVEAGKVTCVLGDNGAGKSSFIKILSGVHHHDAGEVLLDGQEVQFKSPRDALDRGIATVTRTWPSCR
jgi:simple sugar transport system ATP-binding protein